MSDPLDYEDGQGWFFWNETWSDPIGYWDTEEKAREELNRYCVEELGIDIPSSEGVEDELNISVSEAYTRRKTKEIEDG